VKRRHALIASSGLAIASAACTQDVVQASTDCASLMAQHDHAAAAASAEQEVTAAAVRDEGEKLCLEGKTEEGAAKLKEAISQISAGASRESNSRR
jgi:hypothetical protein